MLMGVGERLGRPGGADSVVLFLGLALFAAALFALIVRTARPADPAQRAVGVAVMLSSAAIGGAFVVNRNIFNSDNYRYLVLWMIPWSLGFGLMLDFMTGLRRVGRLVACGLAVAWASIVTIDAGRWSVEHGWLDRDLRPVRPIEPRALLHDHPDATHVYGDYWHVYRLAFLSGGKVTGVPTPFYPNRFAGWSEAFDPLRSTLVVLTPQDDWRGLFEASWKSDGATPGAWTATKHVFWNDPSSFFSRRD